MLETTEYNHRFIDFEEMDGGIYVRNPKTDELIYICRWIDVIKIIMDIITGIVEVEVKYNQKGNIRTCRINRENFTRNKLLNVLPALGIDVTEKNVDSVLEFLLFREESAEHIYIHKKLGWLEIENKYEFLHVNVVGNNLHSTYQGKLNIFPKGNLDGWLQCMRENVLGRTPLELAVCLGLSAPLASRLRRLIGTDVLFFHLYGDSTMGKTTALSVATSTFGYPSKFNEGLIKTWNATFNAMLGYLQGIHGIPIGLDEASLKAHVDYSSMIYQITDGVDKARQNQNGENKERAEWSGTFISTGENSLLDKSNKNIGLRVRLLELAEVQWTESAEHAERVKMQLLENYGHGGVAFVSELMQVSDDELIKSFAKCKAKVIDRITHRDKFTDRIADRIAVIYMTAKLAESFLDLDVDADAVLDMLIEADSKQIEDRNLPLVAYDFIRTEINNNINKFYHDNKLQSYNSNTDTYEEQKTPRGEVIGRLGGKGKKIEEAMIPMINLDKMLKQGGFTDSRIILSGWRSMNLIDCDEGKFTKKRIIVPNTKGDRVVVIRLNVDLDKINEKQRKLIKPSVPKNSDKGNKDGKLSDLFNNSNENTVEQDKNVNKDMEE